MGVLTRQQIRTQGRQIKKAIEKFNDQQVYFYIQEIINAHLIREKQKLKREITDKVLKDIGDLTTTTLHEDFGFGKVRIERFHEGMNRRIEEKLGGTDG